MICQNLLKYIFPTSIVGKLLVSSYKGCRLFNTAAKYKNVKGLTLIVQLLHDKGPYIYYIIVFEVF